MENKDYRTMRNFGGLRGLSNWARRGNFSNFVRGGVGTVPKEGHVFDDSTMWALKMDELIAKAKDKETFKYVAREIESAIDSEKYNYPITYYQIKVSKKASKLGIDLGDLN